MKNLFLIIVLLISSASFAQTKMSCCSMSSTETFAMLASDEKFASAHADPIPFVFEPKKGTMVIYKSADGSDCNAFEVKADKPTQNWIIMVHEWWGLNDYIKQEAEKLQSEIPNTNVLAVDLYDGKVATTASIAQQIMSEVKQDRAITILKGAIGYVGPNAKIATIGWCFGGGWSMQASLLAGRQAVGCVMYYGMPEKDQGKLRSLHADVLGIFAKKDQWINKEIVDQFEKDMKAAGKKLIVHWYDADHAFANPSNPNFNKEAADDAHKYVLAFLKERLK